MKKYTIKKGKNFSKLFGFIPHFGLTTKNKHNFKIKFETNCLYYFNNIDDWDINKLCGISTSYSHHVQSARIGWRCRDGENIEILAYCYNNKERIGGTSIDYVLGVVKPGELFECSIVVEKNKFILNMKMKNYFKEFSLDKDDNSWCVKYFLYPYFGGNNPAPHNMNIWLKRF